jgi:hypothetical protein
MFDQVLGVIAAAALVLVCASICGAAIWHACGLTAGRTAAPTAGLGLLLALSATAIRLPGRAVTSAVVVALAVLIAAGYVVSAKDVRVLPGWAVITAIGVLLVALIPFAASGRAGLLGVGTNNDMGEHLLGAWSLEGLGPISASKIVTSGYPVGPHAIVATISHTAGISLEHAFTGLQIAVPVLLALAATALLGTGPTLIVGLVGALVGLCYLQSGFLAQASFKEPLEALFLIAFAAALAAQREARENEPAAPRRLSAVPMGVIAAGSVYVYSYLGLAWLAGTLAIWALLSAIAGDRLTRQALDRAALGAGAFLVVVAPEIPRLMSFSHSGYNQETSTAFGNLLHPLPPQEALGVWPRLDFRFDVPVASVGGIVALLAVAALVVCLVRLVLRREFILPAALAVGIALWAVNAARSPYSASKALTVLAPVAMLILGNGFVELTRTRRAISSWRAAPAAALAVILGWAAYSDLELLRDAPVGPDAHPRDLARLRELVGKQPTLFLGADDFVHWELRSAQLATPPQPLYATTTVPLRVTKTMQDPTQRRLATNATTLGRLAGRGLGFDFDSVPTNVLDEFTFVVMPRSGYQSSVPPNWRVVARTDSYDLYRRTGPTRPYATLAEVDNPGVTLDCRTPEGRAVADLRGTALVRARPVIGERNQWRGDVGYAGRSTYQDLTLRRGRWTISLQYDAATGVTLRGPGLDATLPANLEPLGPYWSAGTVTVKRDGPVRIVVTFRALPAFGRLVGAQGLTRAPSPTGLKAVGRVTAVPAPVREAAIPLDRACGRYIDHYRVG